MSPRARSLDDRPRIVDVAREAGVSAQTVSNVLNGRPGFTDATRERVLRAVAEIGYVPDAAGRQLRTGESRRIAFSMTSEDLDPRNPFSVSFLQAIVSTAADLERRVIVLNHESELDGSFAADIAGREADGFILANSFPGDYRVQLLEAQRIPYALMGRTAQDQAQEWIDIDNAAAIGDAVDHVIDRGFRRLAFAGFKSEREWLHDRKNGALDRAASRELPIAEDFVLEDSTAGLEHRLRALLSRPDRPDAVVTASDAIGLMTVNIAHSLDIAVGRDLAVTGFDGGPLATMVVPTLTTVRIPVPLIATRLMRRLVEEIRRGHSGRPGEIVQTELVVGGST